MSDQDILGQDEIDALINGAQQDVAAEPAPAAGEAQSFDFGRSARIVRGRMPTLEMINDRFARLFRTTIYNMLRRTAVVAPATLQFVKFGDYVNRLKLLAPGDVLPSDFAGQVTLFAEDVPVFRGTYGGSGGQHALKVSERVGRGRPQTAMVTTAVPWELP